jgi:hypothetical protein
MKLSLASVLIALPFTSGQVDTYKRAPVYMFTGNAYVLERAGTHSYKLKEGYTMLYCVAESEDDEIIECIVHTPSDRLILSEVAASGFKRV